MNSPVTIVMYHYVRDLKRSRYPDLKGLDAAAFRRQLDHLEEHFTIVRMEDVIDAATAGGDLPSDAALLTFDDGYADHYDTVFPMLFDRGLQGSFFPPVAPVKDGTLLDVNRVHFILASTQRTDLLATAIDDQIEAASDDPEIRTVAEYRAEWAHANRFDDANTVYVKRMLQTALPPAFRAEIAGQLFDRFVGVSEETFAQETYLSMEQARVMVGNGMYFGSHGLSHLWLNHVGRDVQEAEVDGSLQFLADLGMPIDDHWVMCYPFGGWNESLLEVLRERNCSIGVTTRVATAHIGEDDPLLLPRLDTNDFPQ